MKTSCGIHELLTLLGQFGGAGQRGKLDTLSEATGQLHPRGIQHLSTGSPLGVLTDYIIFARGLGEVDLGVVPSLALGLIHIEFM